MLIRTQTGGVYTSHAQFLDIKRRTDYSNLNNSSLLSFEPNTSFARSTQSRAIVRSLNVNALKEIPTRYGLLFVLFAHVIELTFGKKFTSTWLSARIFNWTWVLGNRCSCATCSHGCALLQPTNNYINFI